MRSLRCKMKKVEKKNFYIGKKTAKRSLVILFALVIYTAPTVGTVIFHIHFPLSTHFSVFSSFFQDSKPSFSELLQHGMAPPYALIH